MKFPRHDAGLYLTHNDHKSVYETIDQRYENADVAGDWVSEEQRLKAIKEDSVWELIWYPDTPIGSYRFLACDLDVLLAAALEVGP